jgi:hypothetical protein
MSPTSAACGSVRSAAVVNEQIRSVVARAQGRAWTPEERALYGLLLEEWEQAVRAEMTTAA